MLSKKSPIFWLMIIWVIAVIIVAIAMFVGKKPDLPPKNTTDNPPAVNKPITSFDECIKAGYPAMESYPRQCKAPNGITYTEKGTQTIPPQEQITIKGKIVCLPHKGPGKIHTMECAFGLQAEDNNYYSLNDTDPEYKNISTTPMNEPVEVTGKLTLKEGRTYASIGVIDVLEITLLSN